jgi:hypothetical protein
MPINPTTPNNEMNSPAGGSTLELSSIDSFTYVGIANVIAGVKVGKRVAGISTINWAASVGSMVGVTLGVGRDGGSIIGSSSGRVTVTKPVYTQAILPSTPG